MTPTASRVDFMRAPGARGTSADGAGSEHDVAFAEYGREGQDRRLVSGGEPLSPVIAVLLDACDQHHRHL